ncbi:MAG: metal ABC transporter ATP-binding protein [Phycisphaeraceae bacterium]|nr:metal ABC transporter ATP-binding protein [Phycisphaeraceae bacterium]
MSDASVCDDHGCGHGSLDTHRPARDAVCLESVGYRYPPPPLAGRRQGTVALKDVTLHVERGCSLGIIGPNGGGKSTLIKIMLGLLEADEGSVEVLGMAPAKACRKGDIVGYVPQRPEVEWRVPLTVEQVVMMGLTGRTGLFRRHRRSDVEHARSMMDRVGIAGLAQRPIGELSGGQQQRVFIARALAPRPQLLILDEPMVGIDEAGQRAFAELIRQLHRELDLTVIVVSHDLRAVAAGCSRVACLRQSIHYHDSPEGLTPEVLNEVFEHEITPVMDTGEGPALTEHDHE